MRQLYIILLASIFLFNCKKEEIKVTEDYVVNGNTPPNYDGVTTLQIQNYINRLYIDLLGFQPDQTQLDNDVNYLKNNNLSESSREVLIGQITNQLAFYKRLFNVTSARMLNGVGDFEIAADISNYSNLVTFFTAQGDLATAYYFENEVKKLEVLQDADSLLYVDSINVNQFYRAFAYNLIYDDINMGSLNFVVSCFENFFNRLPSATEEADGVEMVDGQSAIILGVNGSTKLDFINIITQSDSFYEGLIYDAYLRFLSRAPNAQELNTAFIQIKNNGDIEQLHRDIVKTDEYASF